MDADPDHERRADQHRRLEDSERSQHLEQDGEHGDAEHRLREPRGRAAPPGQQPGPQPQRRQRHRNRDRREPDHAAEVVGEAH
jgi:hypothetical protein